MLLERRVKMNEDEGFFTKKNSLPLELGVSFFYCRCVLLVVGGHGLPSFVSQHCWLLSALMLVGACLCFLCFSFPVSQFIYHAFV